MTTRTYTATASELIRQQVFDLNVDAAFLNVRSREEGDARDEAMLRAAAQQLSRVSARLERAIRHRDRLAESVVKTE